MATMMMSMQSAGDGNGNGSPPKPPTRPEPQKGSRKAGQNGKEKSTCDGCVKEHAKCDGSTLRPCNRCRRRNLLCSFSTSKTRGPAKGEKKALEDQLANSQTRLAETELALSIANDEIQRLRAMIAGLAPAVTSAGDTDSIAQPSAVPQ